MGSYINGPTKGKADFIVQNYGGLRIAPPTSWEDIPVGKALIVVADNGFFEAAAWAYNEGEFRVFTDDPDDRRPRDYILIDKSVAEKVAS